jgi:hypothetical protein
VRVPVLARLPMVNFKVLEVVAGFGLKDAETRVGRPEADKLTAPVKPFEGVMVTLVLPLEPRAMLRLAGEAESEKSGLREIVREMVVELIKLAQLPLTVTL